MAQIHDEHLTTEQLSASFDKQLSPQEQAVFDAHISTCQQCQSKLSDLLLTAALLRALPEEEVPRSFVLPTSIFIVPDQTIRQDGPFTPIPQRDRTQKSVLRRSIRIVSTLAAVLALCFIISGILPLIYSGGVSSSSTASYNSANREAGTVSPSVTTPGVQQPNDVHPSVGSAPTKTPHSLSPTGTATSKSSSGPNGQNSTIPPAIDISQPGARLGIGVLALAVSIIVLILTRRRRVTVH